MGELRERGRPNHGLVGPCFVHSLLSIRRGFMKRIMSLKNEISFMRELRERGHAANPSNPWPPRLLFRALPAVDPPRFSSVRVLLWTRVSGGLSAERWIRVLFRRVHRPCPWLSPFMASLMSLKLPVYGSSALLLRPVIGLDVVVIRAACVLLMFF